MNRLIATIVLAAVSLGLIGCSTGDDPYIPTGQGYLQELADATGAADPDDTVQQLQLTYYPDRSMNPYLCTDYTNRALFSLLYQSLFTVDRNYKVAPQLCKSYAISQDMRTYTFYPESATFTDGTALTANDVLLSLQAAQQSTYYGGRFTHISQMSLTEDGGVCLQLRTPMEDLPLLLDIPIVMGAQVAADAPLGTGPYYLDLYAQAPVLRRNTNWWCKTQTVVTAPAITLVKATSISGIRDAFSFGDQRLSLVCTDPGSDRYADYLCDFDLWDCENGVFLYLSCNMDSPVFSDPQVRAALIRAIDRDTLAAAHYRGFARSAVLPASPLSPYYSQSLANRYAYDNGEALAQAVADRSKANEKVVLLVNNDDSLRLRVAQDIARTLTAAGLQVTVSDTDSAAYRSALRKKEYDLYLGQTKLSANMDLSAFFSAKGALNYGGIGDIALYTLCTEALANHGNYYTLHKNLLDDGRLCPILFGSYAIYAARGVLTGLAPARDNVFFYDSGRTLTEALLEQS